MLQAPVTSAMQAVLPGRFFIIQFPIMGRLLAPLDPIKSIYFGIPFASLVVFFAVYLGLVNNFRFSRFVRLNALQAVLLDIVLILPGLLESIWRPPTSGVGLQFYISANNTIWLFVFCCVAYGVGASLLGRQARLPFIADAAEQQLR